MNTQAAPYDAPAAYLPRLIDWADRESKRCASVAVEHSSENRPNLAADYVAEGTEYCRIRIWARERLVDISEMALDDREQLAAIQEEDPPRALVPLVDWLRERIGHYFPWVPTKAWQTIGVLLDLGRP